VLLESGDSTRFFEGTFTANMATAPPVHEKVHVGVGVSLPVIAREFPSVSHQADYRSVNTGVKS
jgi:hypothetical protein